MVATVPPFAAVASCEEAHSTSCTEEDVPSLEPSVKSRSLWKVAVVATTVALIVGASASWTRTATEGEEVTALEETYTYMSHGTIGCANWQDIQKLPRDTVTDRAACESLCTSDPLCMSYNFQAAACAPGWEGIGPNACLIFRGGCKTERNTCWELVYKTSGATTITQSLTFDVDGESAVVGAAVETALGAQAPPIGPVTVATSEEGRRLQERRLFLGKATFTYTFVCEEASTCQRVYDFGLSLLGEAAAAFVTSVKTFLPPGTTLTTDTMVATEPVMTNPLPSDSTTDGMGETTAA